MNELPTRTPLPQPAFLPTSKTEMDALGWDELDVLLISGDAYVDHPSFGVPLLGRFLLAHGYRTGIVAQPAWEDTKLNSAEGQASSIARMGRPRLCAGVSAGAIDSMLAHYTAFRKKRHDDAYTPGGRAGARPNRAVIVYANLLRRVFPGLPLLAGGIEASLRRASHYDFWTDSLRRSLLFDARLDLLLFGMGERALLESVRRLDAWADLVGEGLGLSSALPPGYLADIRGTARVAGPEEVPAPEDPPGAKTADAPLRLPSHEAILEDPGLLLEGSLLLERETHAMRRTLLQDCGGRTVLICPPALPLTSQEMDELYALPFSKRPHPSYTSKIPAFEMIATSITTHRGCGGGCSFCSLALHQGRRIASRSKNSILAEASRISRLPGGSSISDVGGPSANMWGASCTLEQDKGPVPKTVSDEAASADSTEKTAERAGCKRTSCLYPAVCPFFKVDQKACIELLREVEHTPGVKHVRVASGVRFDLALTETTALAAYTGEFTGGQLKVAPEHCSPAVLKLMRKPGMAAFESFLAAFYRQSRAQGKEQYVVPYLMSAFPGCTDAHMRELAAWLAERGWSPRQVQCFIPTPGTVATAMFYAGRAPDGSSLAVARSDAARLRQHAILMGTEDTGSPHKTGTKYGGRHKTQPLPQNDGKTQPHTGQNRTRQRTKDGKGNAR